MAEVDLNRELEVPARFEQVAAEIPLRTGGTADALAFKLVSGEVGLMDDTLPQKLGLRGEDRLVKYVRSGNAIIRIEHEDGKITKLDLTTGQMQDMGYAGAITARLGQPLVAEVADMPFISRAPGEPGSNFLTMHFGLAKIATSQLTDGPVTEVLIRTSYEASANLPKTTTALEFVTKQSK